MAAPGLHNVLTDVRLSHKFLDGAYPDGTVERQLLELTDASDAYLLHRTKAPRVAVNYKGKSFEIKFSTSIQSSQSSVDGVSILSTDEIGIKALSPLTVEELLATKLEIEEFISFLCIGIFIPKNVSIHQEGEISATKLIWQAGHETVVRSAERMPHQILLRLGERPDLVGNALEKWFQATEQRSLARWLIYDTLSEQIFFTSRFLSVAQAWEILGREVNTLPVHNKTDFTAACDEASAVLSKRLGPATAERLKGLLKSNNKPNFRNLVIEALKHAPEYALSRICGDISEFARTVSKVRNTLTHMDPDNDGQFSVERASRLSLPLTIKLTVLFCIIEAQSLGLPLDNLKSMLDNNVMARMACRPLSVAR